MHHNQLSGTIPPLELHSNLSILHLQSNLLSSPLPPSLVQAPLFDVDLRDNLFECPTPAWCAASLCAPCFSGKGGMCDGVTSLCDSGLVCDNTMQKCVQCVSDGDCPSQGSCFTPPQCGSGGDCVVQSPVDDGQVCGVVGDVCSVPHSCRGGLCTPDASLWICNDGNPCTFDNCVVDDNGAPKCLHGLGTCRVEGGDGINSIDGEEEFTSFDQAELTIESFLAADGNSLSSTLLDSVEEDAVLRAIQFMEEVFFARMKDTQNTLELDEEQKDRLEELLDLIAAALLELSSRELSLEQNSVLIRATHDFVVVLDIAARANIVTENSLVDTSKTIRALAINVLRNFQLILSRSSATLLDSAARLFELVRDLILYVFRTTGEVEDVLFDVSHQVTQASSIVNIAVRRLVVSGLALEGAVESALANIRFAVTDVQTHRIPPHGGGKKKREETADYSSKDDQANVPLEPTSHQERVVLQSQSHDHKTSKRTPFSPPSSVAESECKRSFWLSDDAVLKTSTEVLFSAPSGSPLGELIDSIVDDVHHFVTEAGVTDVRYLLNPFQVVARVLANSEVHGVALYDPSTGNTLQIDKGHIFVPVALSTIHQDILRRSRHPQLKCVFFDFEQQEWSSRGCEFVGFGDGKNIEDYPECYVCKCTHTTDFAVLLTGGHSRGGNNVNSATGSQYFTGSLLWDIIVQIICVVVIVGVLVSFAAIFAITKSVRRHKKERSRRRVSALRRSDSGSLQDDRSTDQHNWSTESAYAATEEFTRPVAGIDGIYDEDLL